MKPLFIDVVGTDNRKYRVNVNQILYYYPSDKKGAMITEIVFTNKESIESNETASEIEARITQITQDGVKDFKSAGT